MYNKKFNKYRHKVLFFLIIVTLSLNSYLPVLASSIEQSQIFIGTKNMFEDGGKALIVLSPIAGALFCTYFFFRKGAADEMDQKKWFNRIITSIICSVAGMLVGTIITLVASYYNV